MYLITSSKQGSNEGAAFSPQQECFYMYMYMRKHTYSHVGPLVQYMRLISAWYVCQLMGQQHVHHCSLLYNFP